MGTQQIDVALIGCGVMSATIGTMIRQMLPSAEIVVFEQRDDVALESSASWNNAGTGHAALCELNYTPVRADGSVDISRAVNVYSQFLDSRAWWSSLVEDGTLSDPPSFIRTVPHMSFVAGDENVEFLRRRYQAMADSQLFPPFDFSTDHAALEAWAPLIIEGRRPDQAVAMTRTEGGTDVDFGVLTRQLANSLERSGVPIHRGTRVTRIERLLNQRWRLWTSGDTGEEWDARFVFVGAGGNAVRLLRQATLPAMHNYAGFPVSGQFLRCTDPMIVARHAAKVYGLSRPNEPAMTMPHLDTRVIEGKRTLLFGPFAGFTTKFLKAGSWTDVPRLIKPDTVLPMLDVAWHDWSFVTYLMRQVRQTAADRIDSLRDYYPLAQAEAWEQYDAGIRVQIMKPAAGRRGVVQMGTEVVIHPDRSIAGLMGASPGASTSVTIMLDVLRTCFPAEFATAKKHLADRVPTYGTPITENSRLRNDVVATSREILGLSA